MTESVKLPDRLAILCCPNTVLLPGAIFCIRCASSVKLPDRLAILCCPNTVLLPGAIFCIRCASSCSVKLVEQDLLDREEKGLIGFLLVRDAAAPSSGDPDEIVHLHNRGVAARALHLSGKVEKTTGSVTYLVVLEGLCRFLVQELSTGGKYCTARITPLDMMKAEQDPDFIALSRQFQATAVELISIFEEVTLERVGVRDRVILLDDIDKMCFDHWDGPASALLEVFDPEQNKTFNDHYLNVPFDLSKVIFVATANRGQPIPPPLLDRMEVIELTGYTPEEKLRIGMQHLIPRVLVQHGLSFDFFQVPEAMVKLVIRRYTREPGVHDLERNLAALARAAAVRVAEQYHAVRLSKDAQQLASPLLDGRLAGEGEAMFGPSRYDNGEVADRVATPGVSIGLIKRGLEGDLQYVEATAVAGKGDFYLTGQLGNVLKESALTALTWVRARAAELKLVASKESNLLQGQDIHIHISPGAEPKNGPSAGVTIVTSLASLFSQRTVRADTAMTGEMTLKGLVLPVGGIKEKVLAAHQDGIKRIILPEKNLKDLGQVPSGVLSSLEILPVKRMEDVLEQAFEGGFPL